MSIIRLPSVKQETDHRADAYIYNAIREELFTHRVAMWAACKGLA